MSSPLPRPSRGGPRPTPAKDRRALEPYIRVQQATDRQILAVLRSALVEANRELRRLERKVGVSAIVRSDQLRASKQAIFRLMADIWRDTGDIVRARRYDAAAAGVDSQTIYDKVLFTAAGREAEYELLVQGLKAYARNALDLGVARLTTSAIKLSRNVYEAQALATGQIEELLNGLLARGSSAREIARAVAGYISPDVRGGVSYAAMRLGRTELNNAFHATQANIMSISPWVDATQWNLSGSHPQPDECDDFASDTGFNGKAGQYDTGSVPANPHPMCLCFLTPVLMSVDSFATALQGGAFDNFMAAIS